MTSRDIPLLLLLLLALLVAVFLALAEASLLRVSEFRVKALVEEGDKRAGRLAVLLDRLPAVLNLILLLALLAQIGAATVTGILAQRSLGNLGVTIASAILTVVLFVYGEAIPKTYAVRHAELTALRVARPISLLERALRPLVSLLVWIADIQLPGKGITTSPTVTEGELRLLAHRAATEGEITSGDRERIEKAFRFGDRRVDDIMVPRPDIVAVDAEATIDDALELALKHGHRRIPVYSGNLERIFGVVSLRDLAAARDRGQDPVASLSTEPMIVPESKKVSGLLADMQERRNHLAIVVDEYGVTAGLVTVEDIAEVLLGTISHDPNDTLEHLEPGRWLAPGSTPVEDLTHLGVVVPEGEWNTVAGLMIGVAGRLLADGDQVDIQGHRLTAHQVRDRRITVVLIEEMPTVDQA